MIITCTSVVTSSWQSIDADPRCFASCLVEAAKTEAVVEGLVPLEVICLEITRPDGRRVRHGGRAPACVQIRYAAVDEGG
jgi:hypothetical protein